MSHEDRRVRVERSASENSSRRLCSQNTRIPAFANFINKTQRDVAVEWLDFSGGHVPYKRRLAPGQGLPMNTYKEHAWVFYETDTRHRLSFLPDRELIYFPVEWQGGDRVYHEVNIVSPQYSLKQLCLNYLHRHLQEVVESPPERILDKLEQDLLLTKSLASDLKNMLQNELYTNMPIYR